MATGIAPMDLLDPRLPPGFLDRMLEELVIMTKR